MKASLKTIILFAALSLFPALPFAAQSIQNPQIDARMNEGMARARGIAASKGSPVTSQQCTANLSKWEAMDATDEKAKTSSPNLWHEKLSTEELLRLETESQKCALITPLSDHYRMLQFYTRLATFATTLRFRAENILADHSLYHEYLLATSR
jgi:hypothetical protein